MMEMKKDTVKIYKDAGQRIFQIRSMRGYTREELAELAGISAKFLYEIENGRKGFSSASLYFLSSALQVDAGYILTGKDTKGFDCRLAGTLELFKKNQTECIDSILKEIYKLLEHV